MDRRTILCLYVPGFHRQVFKHVKTLRERSKKMKEQKKNDGSVLVANLLTMHKMQSLVSQWNFGVFLTLFLTFGLHRKYQNIDCLPVKVCGAVLI